MKRRYFKPESKTLYLRAGAFITAGSNDTKEYVEDEPIGENDDPEGSRYLRRSMWEE